MKKGLPFLLCCLAMSSTVLGQWTRTTGTDAGPVNVIVPGDVTGEFFAGTPGGVWRSADDGVTWSDATDSIPPTLSVSGMVRSGGDLYICGTSGVTGGGIYKSTDAGATWTAPFSGLPGTPGFAGFSQIDSIVFATHSGGVYRSTDHGATWVAAWGGVPLGTAPLGIRAIGQFLYAGTTKGVYESTDLGTSWTAVNDGLPPGMIVNTLTTDGVFLYAGTDFHGVWKRPLAELTDIGDGYQGLPRAARLEQNYPNPFNPVTKIRYQLAAGAEASLVIYNALGERVATLVDGRRDAGHHEAEWSAEGVSSGVYFAELRAGSIRVTRKMLLVR